MRKRGFCRRAYAGETTSEPQRDDTVLSAWGPNTDLPAVAGQMMAQRGPGKLRRQCDAWSEWMRARRWLGHANEEA